MSTQSETLIALEKRFWEAMVNEDTHAATELLREPALMVSGHGTMKFDHAGYRKMATEGSMTLTGFELRDIDVMFPNDTTAIVTYRVKQDVEMREGGDSSTQEMNDTSTWVKTGSRWQCVMHTETPAEAPPKSH